MKKVFLIIGLCSLLLAGCVTTDPRVSVLEQRMDKVEQQVKIAMAGGAAASFRPFRLLTGNTTGSLDSLSAASISLKDVAFVATDEDAAYGNAFFVYTYTDHGAAVSDNPPYEIKPDSGTPNANHAWTLALSSVAPAKVISSTPHTLTVGEARAGFAQITVTGEIDLPAAATVGYGTTWCVAARDAEVITLDPNGSEILNINGGPLAAGVAATSDGAAGDYSCFVAVSDTGDGSTDGWWQLGYGKTAWQ